MIFKTESKVQAAKCLARVEYLINKKAKIEVIHKKHKRTLSQNAYLYLLLKYYGLQVGLNMIEAKTDFKALNSDIFNYEKNGNWYIKSTAELDKEEMMICLDRFIKESAENGILLPRPDEQEFLEECSNEVELANIFL